MTLLGYAWAYTAVGPHASKTSEDKTLSKGNRFAVSEAVARTTARVPVMPDKERRCKLVLKQFINLFMVSSLELLQGQAGSVSRIVLIVYRVWLAGLAGTSSFAALHTGRKTAQIHNFSRSQGANIAQIVTSKHANGCRLWVFRAWRWGSQNQ